MNEYEYEFVQDSIEKKKISRGAYHKVSKLTGSTGPMRTYVDFLSGKARQEYIKPGEVVRKYMYDYVQSKEDYMELPREERKKFMSHYLIDENYTKKELAARLSVDRPNFINDQLRMLGIMDDMPKMRKGSKHTPKVVVKEEKKIMPTVEKKPEVNNLAPNYNLEQDTQVFVRKMLGAEIQEKVMGKLTALDKSATYFISLQITELIEIKKEKPIAGEVE